MGIVTIVVPPPLRGFVDGRNHLTVEAGTVRQAIAEFVAHSDALSSTLLDDSKALRRFVRVFVDDMSLRMPSDEDRPLQEGAHVTLLMALAGG
jgi:molybdopterin synthase sulfur carrier subunit